MGNFRKFPGNFLETVRVVTGQETVRVGMWSHEIVCKICFNLLDDIDYHLKEAQVGFNSFLYFRQQRFFTLVCTGFYEIEYGVIARELRRKTLVLI